MIQLIESSKEAKRIYDVRNQDSGYLGRVVTGWGLEGMFYEADNDLFLRLGTGYMGVFLF